MCNVGLTRSSTGPDEGLSSTGPRIITQWLALACVFVMLVSRWTGTYYPAPSHIESTSRMNFGIWNTRSLGNTETLTFSPPNSFATGDNAGASSSVHSSHLRPDASDRILPPPSNPVITAPTEVSFSRRGATKASSPSSSSTTTLSSNNTDVVPPQPTDVVPPPQKGGPQTMYPMTINGTTVGLHVVVSHCKLPLDRIWEKTLDGEQWKSLTIYSKCGVPPSQESLPWGAKVVILPNVGRCDHSYAYWIANMVASIHAQNIARLDKSNSDSDGMDDDVMYQPQDHVLFIKDNDNAYRRDEARIPWKRMKTKTTTKGFSCSCRLTRELLPNMKTTNVASLSSLGGFHLELYKRPYSQIGTDADTVPFSSTFKSLENWARSVQIGLKLGSEAPVLPDGDEYRKRKVQVSSSRRKAFFSPYSQHFVPICYGGHFMATIERIMLAPLEDWNLIVDSLSRGDNIEEGHFMERLWAALLSQPITRAEEEAFLEMDYAVIRSPKSHPYTGIVTIKE